MAAALWGGIAKVSTFDKACQAQVAVTKKLRLQVLPPLPPPHTYNWTGIVCVWGYSASGHEVNDFGQLANGWGTLWEETMELCAKPPSWKPARMRVPSWKHSPVPSRSPAFLRQGLAIYPWLAWCTPC